MIRLHDVLAGTEGYLAGNLDQQHLFSRVVHDSRQVEPGDLFVALQGESLDGHDFVPAAIDAGATTAMVSESWYHAQDTLPFPVVVVPDTLDRLQRLATYWRGLFEPRVLGITGSIGKSSTKEVVAAVAGSHFNVVKSPGSYNNEIGLPLTVLDVNPETEILILEMGGAYAAGEIAELVEIARPEIGIVTNVTHSHLSRMGSLDAIAETKAELIDGLPEHGLAILNADDDRVRAMGERASCRVLYYGLDESADIRATNLESLGVEGLSFTLVRGDREDHVQVPLLGLHSVHTALIGFAAGFELGLDPGDILRGFDAPNIQLRLVLTPGVNGSTILDDHYNSNPKSSFAALGLLEDLDAGRRIAVLADMLELGLHEEEGHRDVGRRAAEVVDVLYTVGPLAKMISDEALTMKPELDSRHFEDKESLVEALRAALQPDDLVLIKGSRGMKMETVVAALREPSEQESD